MNKSKLRDLLVNHFEDDELEDLCFDLDLPYSDLKGDTRKSKARELVKYFDNRNELSVLVAKCQELRPNVVWEESQLSDISVEDNDPVTPLLDMSPSNLRYGPGFSGFVDLSEPNWSEPYQSWWQRLQG